MTSGDQRALGKIRVVGDKLLKSFQERMLFLPSFWRPLPDSVAGPGAIPEKRRSSWCEPGMCWAPYPVDNCYARLFACYMLLVTSYK